MESKQGLPIIPFSSPSDWKAWLEEHHALSEGLWLKLAKKGSGVDSVTYGEALDVALCYGWIDSQKAGLDVRFYLQRFTPRRGRSKWSKINRDKATELIERGEMKPTGLREVELAKADGRWEAAYASQSKATVPDDLQRELDANPAAKTFFADLDSANRYAILYRIEEAKRPETRRRRIAKYIGMLERGEKIH
ncbi:YdeI family protein [soil metagenome]